MKVEFNKKAWYKWTSQLTWYVDKGKKNMMPDQNIDVTFYGYEMDESWNVL